MYPLSTTQSQHIYTTTKHNVHIIYVCKRHGRCQEAKGKHMQIVMMAYSIKCHACTSSQSLTKYVFYCFCRYHIIPTNQGPCQATTLHHTHMHMCPMVLHHHLQCLLLLHHHQHQLHPTPTPSPLPCTRPSLKT